MEKEDLKILPYTATSLSVVGRFIFMFLIYKNKSMNTLSLIFCILSIFHQVCGYIIVVLQMIYQ